MTTYVMRAGALVEKRFIPNPARSALQAPQIISDTVDGFLSHADGKMYDSKSRYYSELKARGLRIVEEKDGMPPPSYIERPVTEDDVGRAYQKVNEGYKPMIADDGLGD